MRKCGPHEVKKIPLTSVRFPTPHFYHGCFKGPLNTRYSFFSLFPVKPTLVESDIISHIQMPSERGCLLLIQREMQNYLLYNLRKTNKFFCRL